jgi:hypothetical protein
MTIEPFWVQVSEPALRQGDLLPRCLLPSLSATRRATAYCHFGPWQPLISWRGSTERQGGTQPSEQGI